MDRPTAGRGVEGKGLGGLESAGTVDGGQVAASGGIVKPLVRNAGLNLAGSGAKRGNGFPMVIENVDRLADDLA